MAKKIKNKKLLKNPTDSNIEKMSAFNSYANRMVQARLKKSQKIDTTKKRLADNKRHNKMINMSKKVTKFSLIEDKDMAEAGMTHRGRRIHEIKQFNDVEFGQEDEQDDQFQNAHENINFQGFQQDQTANALHSKNKHQIYKQIINKSKQYKRQRQQQYENNFNSAVQLDQQFHNLVGKLQFRNRGAKARDQIFGRDVEYDRLINQLKQDQRVVSAKIVQKKSKYEEQNQKKKTQQLKQIMKDSDGQDGDIRGWIEQVQQMDSSQQQEGDEMDQVDLSSQEDYSDEDKNSNIQLQVQSEQQQVHSNSQQEHSNSQCVNKQQQISSDQQQKPQIKHSKNQQTNKKRKIKKYRSKGYKQSK